MNRKDIIRWVIDRMMAHDDSITEEMALQVEREAREEWGGQRIEYVPKGGRAGRPRSLTSEAESALGESAGRVSAAELAGTYGVDRSTVYRALKRRGSGA